MQEARKGDSCVCEVYEEQGYMAVDYTHRDGLRGSLNGTDDILTGTTHTCADDCS
jgi:hypothetical protein